MTLYRIRTKGKRERKKTDTTHHIMEIIDKRLCKNGKRKRENR
jgi:hypothetical protein